MNALYFAFGSNLDAMQMRARCPRAQVECSAVLRGYRLGFAGYSSRWGGGVATLDPDPAGRVEGLLYRLPVSDLIALDRFEGRPVVYERVRVSVRDALGRRRRAQTYVLVAPRIRLEPGVAYVSVILRAYVRHGFDRRALLAAAFRTAA